jgi:hypothetical protein
MKIYLILLACIISSCKTVPLTGIYISNCRLYGHPEYIIQIENDSTFTRIHPYLKGISWSGKWTQKVDPIIMTDIYEIGENTGKELIDTTDSIILWNRAYVKKKNYLIEIQKNNKHSCKIKKQK